MAHWAKNFESTAKNRDGSTATYDGTFPRNTIRCKTVNSLVTSKQG